MLSPSHFLVIIDEGESDKTLEDYFSKFGYQIKQYPQLSPAVEEYNQASALLINWKLIIDRQSVIHHLYRRCKIPIIIISDEKNADVCVRMLEEGADDFLIKPLLPRELHARISSISRRVQRAAKDIEQEKDVYIFANWRLYPSSRRLIDEQQRELSLSAGEYDLLYAFVRQPQRVLGREFLLQITKSSLLNPFDRRIDVQISRLRQKIETNAKSPALIKTIRNGGYFFTAPVRIVREGQEG